MNRYTEIRGIQIYVPFTKIEEIADQFYYSLSPSMYRSLKNKKRLPHLFKVEIDRACLKRAIQVKMEGGRIQHRDKIYKTMQRNPKFVRKLQQTLNEKEQQILKLWGANIPCPEIGQLLDLDLTIVKWMMKRIRIKLRYILSTYGSGPFFIAA